MAIDNDFFSIEGFECFKFHVIEFLECLGGARAADGPFETTRDLPGKCTVFVYGKVEPYTAWHNGEPVEFDALLIEMHINRHRPFVCHSKPTFDLDETFDEALGDELDVVQATNLVFQRQMIAEQSTLISYDVEKGYSYALPWDTKRREPVIVKEFRDEMRKRFRECR